ncbi:MAG TPA: hypothetical protein VGN81_34855 [Pseudonocardiaceae bacterium]
MSERRGPIVITVMIAIIVLGGAALFLRNALGNAPITPPAAQHVSFDPAKPYANTPAATWSDGIALPTPVSVGNFSAQQVGTAEAAARQVLVAGHLDNRVLVDHDPSTFLSLFAPNMQTHIRHDINNPATPDYGGMLTLLMSGYHLLPVPIKVDGNMTPRVNAAGNLVIHTNYVFAYPFAPADPSTIDYAWQVVAVVHVQADLENVTGSRYAAADLGLWVSNASAYVASESCSAADKGFLAPAYSDEAAPGASANAENPDAFYDPNHAMKIQATCDNK